jgi:hypothetical protein
MALRQRFNLPPAATDVNLGRSGSSAMLWLVLTIDRHLMPQSFAGLGPIARSLSAVTEKTQWLSALLVGPPLFPQFALRLWLLDTLWFIVT